MVITGFLGTANFILQRQCHHFRILDLERAHQNILQESRIMSVGTSNAARRGQSKPARSRPFIAVLSRDFKTGVGFG
jgi:hypothetical protein